jgi:two-component sensor histidine kinase
MTRLLRRLLSALGRECDVRVERAIADAQARAELAACRARIVATADEVRRRIERDLHDGAQQRLVSLLLQLRAAQKTVPPELSRLRAELDRVEAGLEGTLEELREYAHGVHPAILTDGGLAPALKALARRSPVPVTLQVHLAGRLPEHVEVTAYYVVSEALANAAKHAGASAVHVDADTDDDVLRLAVRDDGIGGADPARGSGLAGLHDRVEAIGGTLRMRSRPDEGTTLLAELPARPGPPPPASRLDGEIFILAGPAAPDVGNGGRARTGSRSRVSARRQIPRMLSGRPAYASVQGAALPGPTAAAASDETTQTCRRGIRNEHPPEAHREGPGSGPPQVPISGLRQACG